MIDQRHLFNFKNRHVIFFWDKESNGSHVKMACSCVGLISVIIGSIAMIFSWLAFGLPLWSANGSVVNKASQFASAKFAAGVWGVCTNVEFTANNGSGESSAERCYLYYTSQKVTAFVRENTNTTELDTVDIDDSLCGRWNQLPKSERRNNDNVPVEIPVTAKFLRDTCGSLGKGTLAMATLAPIFENSCWCFYCWESLVARKIQSLCAWELSLPSSPAFVQSYHLLYGRNNRKVYMIATRTPTSMRPLASRSPPASSSSSPTEPHLRMSQREMQPMLPMRPRECKLTLKTFKIPHASVKFRSVTVSFA